MLPKNTDAILGRPLSISFVWTRGVSCCVCLWVKQSLSMKGTHIQCMDASVICQSLLCTSCGHFTGNSDAIYFSASVRIIVLLYVCLFASIHLLQCKYKAVTVHHLLILWCLFFVGLLVFQWLSEQQENYEFSSVISMFSWSIWLIYNYHQMWNYSITCCHPLCSFLSMYNRQQCNWQ